MKLILPVIALLILFEACQNEHSGTAELYKDVKTQSRIDSGFIQSCNLLNDSVLFHVTDSLTSIKVKSNELKYWTAYCYYNLCIYYFIVNEGDDCNAMAKKGIKALESIRNKNSECLALISLLYGIRSNFASMPEVPLIAEKTKKFAGSAIQSDSLNPRAYLAMGIYNFYSPHLKQHEKINTEKMFLNSILYSGTSSLTWGQNTAYYYLIKLMVFKKEFSEAEKLFLISKKRFNYDKRFKNFKYFL